MRISRMLKKIFMPSRSQKGFSIAEVMIAGTLLALVSMPMLQMFNSSLQMSQLTDDFNKVQICVRSYSEMARALPFYQAYTGTNKDMDDYFWGDGRGTANSWSTAPEVVFKDYGTTAYPQFKVTVKMVYLADTLAEATMKANWGPKKPSYDQPVSSDNNVIHMIKYEVKAYWQSSTGGEKNFSTAAIRTDSEAEVGLLVSSCTNTSADAAKHGTKVGQIDDNTAPHTQDAITILIKGKGFVSGSTTVKLAMDKNADITVNVTSVTSTEITGTVSLTTGGTAGFPWSPKRSPGGWAAMVFVNKGFAVLLDGFIVEFPVPKLVSVNPVQGSDTASALSIAVTGTPFISLTGNCKAVLRLVKKSADGTPDTSKAIDSSTVAVITTTGTTSYTVASNTITATFDLTGHDLGEYYLWVVNCRDYTNIGQLGDATGSSQNATAGAFVFSIIQIPPTVTSVYETASPNRTYGFNNRVYNLTIRGADFDTAGVTVFIGRPNAAPNTPNVLGINTIVSDSSTITANFDLSSFSGNEGQCWVWVRNNRTSLAASKANVYEVRRPPRISTVTNVDGDTRVAGTFKYNYYDIGTQLDGQDLYSGYQVYYQKSTGGTVYQVGVNDGAETFSYSSGTRFTCDLNLIGLPVGSYNIWVADASESLNATSASFTCEYGAPILLAAGSPYSPTSVTIASRRGSTNYISSESSTPSIAFARNSTSTSSVKVKFKLDGMGFLDSSTANKTNVAISAGSFSGDFYAIVNRASQGVTLYTSNTADPVADWVRTSTNFIWTLPTAAVSTYSLTLANPSGYGGATPAYAARWQTLGSNPSTW
jgi:hypothetical protein